MVLVFRTSVEIPLETYKKIQLLVAEGEFSNLREAINKGLELVLKNYDENRFKGLEEKYGHLINKIENSKSKIVRIRSRRVFI